MLEQNPARFQELKTPEIAEAVERELNPSMPVFEAVGKNAVLNFIKEFYEPANQGGQPCT